MRIVIALGGNALLQRGQPMDAGTQRRNIARATTAIAALAGDHQLVVTHGNGPQIGLLALQAMHNGQTPSFPLDVLGAESEGMIGYVIEQELAVRLPDREIATLLTQIVVDPGDPAFDRPDKPIGPVYRQEEARRLGAQLGWTIGPDGNGYRRLVPSPRPRSVREIRPIRRLVEAGVLVICAGGGGIPVVLAEDGGMRGIEAVIDKDRTSALIAAELNADALLILTDVPGVYAGWKTPEQRMIRRATPAALGRHRFEAGSMAPKIEAACGFVRDTSRIAAIGALGDASAILSGRAGTTIRDEGAELEFCPPDEA